VLNIEFSHVSIFCYIDQKIEMPFLDYEMTAMSMTQYKNYTQMMKAKLPTDVQEIILSYVFYDSKRQTHACILNINNDIEYVGEYYLDRSHREGVCYINWSNYLWVINHCSVCKKPYTNFKYYHGINVYDNPYDEVKDEDEDATWEVCDKCNFKYDPHYIYCNLNDDKFVAFMTTLCDNKTEIERDGIFEKYYNDEESDEERPLCKDCEIETKKYCDVCGGWAGYGYESDEEDDE